MNIGRVSRQCFIKDSLQAKWCFKRSLQRDRTAVAQTGRGGGGGGDPPPLSSWSAGPSVHASYRLQPLDSWMHISAAPGVSVSLHAATAAAAAVRYMQHRIPEQTSHSAHVDAFLKHAVISVRINFLSPLGNTFPLPYYTFIFDIVLLLYLFRKRITFFENHLHQKSNRFKIKTTRAIFFITDSKPMRF